MYCWQCGRENNDTSKFCAGCGAAFYGDAQTVPTVQAQPVSLVCQLDCAYQYFAPKGPVYDHYASLLNQVATFEKTHGLGVAWLFGVPIAFLGLLSDNEWLLLLWVILGCAVGFGGMLFLKKRYQREYQRLLRHEGAVYNELTRYYAAYMNCPVTFEYSSPGNIASIRHLVSIGRADTVKEAINLIYSETQQQQLYEQVRQGTAAGKASAIFSGTNMALNLFRRR